MKPATKQNKAVTIFDQSLGDQSWLYNGPGYAALRDLKTNANFDDVTTTNNGSVVYNGYTYPNIPILFDIERQLVVTAWNDGESLFSLHSNKVSAFSLLGHNFIRIDSADNYSLASGFYDMLYNGKVQVLAKRTKRLHIMKELKSPDDSYEYYVHYYLKKGGKYYGISSRGDMVSTLVTHEKELKKFINQNSIQFTEADMVQLATYYDTLTN